jgi:diguanylate cyclase (GGDEF)-like protein
MGQHIIRPPLRGQGHRVYRSVKRLHDSARGADQRTHPYRTRCMPTFLTSEPEADTIAALGEALDLLDVGVAVLDPELRVRIVNRCFTELWPQPADTAPTLCEPNGEIVQAFDVSGNVPGHVPGASGGSATAQARLEAAMCAGAFPRAEIVVQDGSRLLLRCVLRHGGGRVLTCDALGAIDQPGIDQPGDHQSDQAGEHAANQSVQARDAAEQLAIDLRFSNETLESQASYLASLAEAADANAQAAEEAKRLLEHEVAERRQLEDHLRHMATTDAPTGTLNRAQFMNLGQREVDRVRQRDLGLAMLMVDVDHFESINDRYGHQAGDTALCHLVSVLRAGIRRVDLLGGEEFAIVLPAIGEEGAGAVAERLRANLASDPVLHDAQQIRMTISIGLAVLRDDDRTLGHLLARADMLLYAAKHAGRNRVVSETPAIAA